MRTQPGCQFGLAAPYRASALDQQADQLLVAQIMKALGHRNVPTARLVAWKVLSVTQKLCETCKSNRRGILRSFVRGFHRSHACEAAPISRIGLWGQRRRYVGSDCRAAKLVNLMLANIHLLSEAARYRARDVRYFGGSWAQLKEIIPNFEVRDFAAFPNAPANPHLLTIVRLPLTPTEQPMPVGVVSPAYSLVQHREIGELAIECLRRLDFNVDQLHCEVGLSIFGEWMNLRVHLGEEFNLTPADGHLVNLRLEIFNSVDGSSRLVMMMSWLRLICSNGLTVRDTITQLGDVHNRHLDLRKLSAGITKGIASARRDQSQLIEWGAKLIERPRMERWADGLLAEQWGKKAAARCLHICRTGYDGDLQDLFEAAAPSERRMIRGIAVPGAPVPARTVYDVAQALAWIATNRSNAEQRVAWQANIPAIVRALGN